MFETYRMLGEQRELELLRDAQRLHAGRPRKEGSVLRTAGSRLVSILRVGGVAFVMGRRGAATDLSKTISESKGATQ